MGVPVFLEHHVSNTTLLRAPWSVVNVIDTRCFYIWVFQTYLVQLSIIQCFFHVKWKGHPFGHHMDPMFLYIKYNPWNKKFIHDTQIIIWRHVSCINFFLWRNIFKYDSPFACKGKIKHKPSWKSTQNSKICNSWWIRMIFICTLCHIYFRSLTALIATKTFSAKKNLTRHIVACLCRQA